MTTEATQAHRREPIEDLLIKVGQSVLKDELHSPWFNAIDIAKVCRSKRLQLAGQIPKSKSIDYASKTFFHNHDKILGDGIKVTYTTEWADKGLELRLKFHRFDPANDSCIPYYNEIIL